MAVARISSDAYTPGNLISCLEPVFGGPPTFVSESVDVVARLRDDGYPAYSLSEVSDAPSGVRKRVVLIAASFDAIPPYPSFHRLFKSSRVLIIPVASFDPSPDAVAYALRLLSISDFRQASWLNRTWLERLQANSALHFLGEGCDVWAGLRDDLHLMKPKTEPSLRPGEWEAIGSYFEVGMIQLEDSCRPGYDANGVLTVDGVCVARHRGMPACTAPLATGAWDLFAGIRERGQFPIHVVIEESRVAHVSAGGEDITPQLQYLANDDDLVLCELAIGTNLGLAGQHIDWGRNCQVNEGVAGMHVGIGNGVSGAHIDFICPGVTITTEG